MAAVKADPQNLCQCSTANGWSKPIGKEDAMCLSVSGQNPVCQSDRDGRICPQPQYHRGHVWALVHDSGEMTYMNLIHLAECDGRTPTA